MPVNQIFSTSHKHSYMLRIDIPKGNQLYNTDLENHHIVQCMSLCRQSVSSSRGIEDIGAFVSMYCMLKEMCVKLKSMQQLGMKIYLDTYEIYSSRKIEHNNLMIKGSFTRCAVAQKQE